VQPETRKKNKNLHNKLETFPASLHRQEAQQPVNLAQSSSQYKPDGRRRTSAS